MIDSRPRLFIEPAAWERLWLYIQLAEGEVGGLGTVVPEPDGSGDFRMLECYLIDQRATDVDTELDPGATSQFLLDYLADGKDPGTLRVWWHSHARESCFWSQDDERTIDHFGGEWLVSVVGNFRGKFLARFDRYEPSRLTIGWLDLVPPGPPPEKEGPLADEVRAELERRVTVVRRRTNKLWTDTDMPKRGGH